MADKPTKILDLFDRQVDRHIEEVIKVDQTDREVVREEIEEYVVTDQIRKYFLRVLNHYRETPNKPHEDIGVWISGFFGAGKSSFAKVLGYVLENRDLDGTTASDLFARQVAEPRLEALLEAINEQIPTRSIIFDVATDQAVSDASERLTDIVYRVLLRELGYATDREIAELEIELEGQDRLTEFEQTFERVFDGDSWDEVKHLAATARSRASRVLHEMDPDTWPEADSWARSGHEVKVTANLVAERAYELSRRRADGRAIVFVVDEVGQYVARSTEKMLDLQGLVQALGREGHNRAQDWTGQVWLMVTSQERLTEVVDNLEGKQVELARLQDRFPIEVDLAPSDIREVTAERVLKKSPGAAEYLRDVFSRHRGKLQEGTRLGSGGGGGLDPESFVELYPFLPHHVDLVIKIVSGLRTQRGASRHVGGANRTIIKLAQQVLINERTELGGQPVGRLVTLDLLYELLEGLIPTERKHDVGEIEERFSAGATSTKVAKALALLEFVPDVPSTKENLAGLLHPAVDADPLGEEVAGALDELEQANKARPGEDGWQLLSRVGKSWEEERRGIEVFPRQRTELVQELAEEIFEEVRPYRHQNLRSFRPRPVINGQPASRGDVELRVDFVTDPERLESARDRTRRESNTEKGRNALHWVVPLADELVRCLDDLQRSRDMVRRYEGDTPSNEQARLLESEKGRVRSRERKARKLLKRSFRVGESYLRGVGTPLEDYGNEPSNQVRAALKAAVPEIYPKFELAVVSVGSRDAVKILESDSLGGLPGVYYEGDKGMGLVRREDGEYRVHTDHPALTEVFEYIEREDSYGNQVAGKALENCFTGFGYGWDLEAVKLLTATLFRAAQIELYRGKRYTSFADPGVREVFRKTQTFRSASFAPREEGGLSLEELTDVAKAIEQIYGQSVTIEEGAIAKELRDRMPREALGAERVLGRLEAEGFPGAEDMREVAEALDGVAQDAAEDTVLAFHRQREAIEEGLERLRRLERVLSDSNLEALREARESVDILWPQLKAVDRGDDLEEVADALEARLASPDFFDHLGDISKRGRRLRERYEKEREELEEELEEHVRRAQDTLRNREEWESLEDVQREALLRPFEEILKRGRQQGTRLTEIQSLRRSLPSHLQDAKVKLIELHGEATAEDGEEGGEGPTVRRVRTGDLAPGGLRSKDDVEEFLEQLRKRCLEALARGEIVILE